MTSTTQFSLACVGPNGTGNASVVVSVLPPPGPLPAWVNALAIGQWYEIPNTALSSVQPSPVPPGNGPEFKSHAWNSFVMDYRTSKVYTVANGGHNDYAGNEVDVLALEAAQPAWVQLLGPTPTAQLTNCQAYYSDGRPVSRHSYYGVTLDEFHDRIMLFGGAHWCESGGFFRGVSSYNIGSNTYNGSGTHPNTPSVLFAEVAYSLDPLTGNVYGIVDRELARWNRSANTWTTLSPAGSAPSGSASMSAMDRTRGRMLVLGGYNSDRHLYTLSSNTWTQVTLTGPNAGNVSGERHNAALLYVEAIDRYLIRFGSGGGTVYQVHPTTFEVTTFTSTGGGSIPSAPHGPYNKFLYAPRLGGVAYSPNYTGNTWFLRLH